MQALASAPVIEPTVFDLIVVGTGLPESIIAAAASSAGRSVLHVDPNFFYGFQFSSLPVPSFIEFIEAHHKASSSISTCSTEFDYNADYVAVEANIHPLYSDLDLVSHLPEEIKSSRNFYIDLCGPRIFLCADSMVDILIKSGASHHVEFKSIDASFIYFNGTLSSVPDSREAIFKDRNLGLREKSQMMKFFKLVHAHLRASLGEGNDEDKISEEDHESSFVVFLKKQGLPPFLISVILYAIIMADCDQESSDDYQRIISTKDGISCLSLYQSSIGRFPNASGPFIYPIYGQGELSQAFCRCAAVKGALYVLRMPVKGFLLEKDAKHYKGVTLETGQDIFSSQILVNPSVILPPLEKCSVLNEEASTSSVDNLTNMRPTEKVARSICIIKDSIKKDLSNIIIHFPPRSLHAAQVTSVRAFQLSSNASVCPQGLFLLYMSTTCQDAAEGKKSLDTALGVLTDLKRFRQDETEVSGCQEDETESTIIWNASYIQETAEMGGWTTKKC